MAEPSTLYHYTSTQAFVAIVEGKCLWLSSRHNQNDSNEGHVFEERLKEIAEEEALSHNVDKILADLKNFEPYVCCFSADDDLLSQWRGYANNATGVSIGFKRSSLIDLIRGDGQVLLRPVSYADESKDLSADIRRPMLAMLRSSGTPSADFQRTAAKMVWEIKNRAFREEAEHRLIFLPAASGHGQLTYHLGSGASIERKYRAADGGIREYCELRWADMLSAITRIVVGPRSDSDVEAMKRFLRRAGCSADVVPSKATFR